MRGEAEVREALEKLEREYKYCVERGCSRCYVELDGILIETIAWECDEIREWIRALKWVLGEEVEPL